ncbi:hypothetical protein BAUR920_00460 [Brevibacterium aurantiacum]|uniref:Uncharacterized protein n=1 Tax=Brevibacterium aurantiacum TaxID=273384 RepID=A0A2H1HZD8_BREAU|nr:hypothetical protein BAUR920_00460 [Brevibacterium aurantiacum]
MCPDPHLLSHGRREPRLLVDPSLHRRLAVHRWLAHRWLIHWAAEVGVALSSGGRVHPRLRNLPRRLLRSGSLCSGSGPLCPGARLLRTRPKSVVVRALWRRSLLHRGPLHWWSLLRRPLLHGRPLLHRRTLLRHLSLSLRRHLSLLHRGPLGRHSLLRRNSRVPGVGDPRRLRARRHGIARVRVLLRVGAASGARLIRHISSFFVWSTPLCQVYGPMLTPDPEWCCRTATVSDFRRPTHVRRPVDESPLAGPPRRGTSARTSVGTRSITTIPAVNWDDANQLTRLSVHSHTAVDID